MGKKIESISLKTVSLVLLVLFAIPGLVMINAALISSVAGPPIIDLLMRFLFISIGISLIISTIGLFKSKKWARFFTIVIAKILFIPVVILAIISLILGIKRLIVSPSGSFFASPVLFFASLILSFFYLIAALFLIFLIYYLNSPKIIEKFK